MQIALPVALNQVSVADDGDTAGSPTLAGEASVEAPFTLGSGSGDPSSAFASEAAVSGDTVVKAELALSAGMARASSQGNLAWPDDVELLSKQAPRPAEGSALTPPVDAHVTAKIIGERVVESEAFLQSGVSANIREVAKARSAFSTTGREPPVSVTRNQEPLAAGGSGENAYSGRGEGIRSASERLRSSDNRLNVATEQVVASATRSSHPQTRAAADAAARLGASGDVVAVPGPTPARAAIPDESTRAGTMAMVSDETDARLTANDGMQSRHESGRLAPGRVFGGQAVRADDGSPSVGNKAVPVAMTGETREDAIESKSARDAAQPPGAEEALKRGLSSGGTTERVSPEARLQPSLAQKDVRQGPSELGTHAAQLSGKVSGFSARISKATSEPPILSEAEYSQGAQNQAASRTSSKAPVAAVPKLSTPASAFPSQAISAEFGETVEGLVAFDRGDATTSSDVRREPTANSAPASAPLARAASRQIIDSIRFPMDGTIEIKLSPEELGRVKLSMAPGEAGAMTIQLTVERAETLELLRRFADLLAGDLRDAGYSGLQFSFNREGEGDPSTQDAEDMRRAGHGKSDDDTPPLTRTQEGHGPSGSGVDLRL